MDFWWLGLDLMAGAGRQQFGILTIVPEYINSSRMYMIELEIDESRD